MRHLERRIESLTGAMPRDLVVSLLFRLDPLRRRCAFFMFILGDSNRAAE
jgi:hypothetical protein